jgi:hypothetical protein
LQSQRRYAYSTVRSRTHDSQVSGFKLQNLEACVDNKKRAGRWRKLHNEELRDLYASPSIIRMIMSRSMRWAGHVARMGRREIYIGYCWESQKERDHWVDQDEGGWIILKWILER